MLPRCFVVQVIEEARCNVVGTKILFLGSPGVKMWLSLAVMRSLSGANIACLM